MGEDRDFICVHVYIFNVYICIYVWCISVGGCLMTNKFTEEQILTAFHNEEFIPYFQPVFDSKESKLIGVEVLMRWQHPNNGIVNPDLFINQVEKSGVIVNITRGLILNTAKLLCKHRWLFPKDFHVSFNITPLHFEKEQLIIDCMEFYDILSRDNVVLVLELTERGAFECSANALAILEKLTSIGVKLALDDFGTGYSNLKLLQRYPFDYVKIDKDIVSEVAVNFRSKHIVDCIISLSRKLSFSVIAEGVETKYQERYLKENGVDYFQGFLYSPPLNFYDILNLLKYIRALDAEDVFYKVHQSVPHAGSEK